MRTLPLLVAFPLLSLASASAPNFTVDHLTCEGLVDPGLVDTPAPRFSWQLVSDLRGARQAAYQLRVVPLRPDNQPAGEAIELPRTASDQSQWVNVPRWTPAAKTRYAWQVRAWDEGGRDSDWSAPAHFETGLLGRPWPAAWIGDGAAVPRDTAAHARYFRGEFDAPAAPVKARLYLSAFGLVEPWLNGQKVGEDFFLPGWPDYRRRVFYVAYDVTAQVRAGHNAIGLILGDGWYSSTMMRATQAGTEPLVSAALELTDAAGQVTTIATGKDWRCA